MFATSMKSRLSEVLQCGLTPHKLALTLCLGMAIGVLPVLWGATLLCAVCCHFFRLNHIALQTLNYLAYPLQIALFIPFYFLGERLFPWGPSIPHTSLVTMLHGHLFGSFDLLAWITVKALFAWLITAVPLALFMYLPVVDMLEKRFGRGGEELQ